MIKRKLQVFISSTYLDLKNERQAAVEAILGAGHIPAGMELFKAGNNSQLNTIKKWINQSDIYMLILGGRYGTIEVSSGKSYTQLEYEYAIMKGIPVFAVVLSDDFLKRKSAEESNVYEDQNQKSYDEFKVNVKSKMIKEVNEIKDIQIGIFESLKELEEENKFSGWIPGNLVDNNYNMINRYETIKDMEEQIKHLQDRILTSKIKKVCGLLSQKVTVHCVIKNIKNCDIKYIEITSLLEIFYDLSMYLQKKDLTVKSLRNILNIIIVIRYSTIEQLSILRIVHSDLDKIIYQLSNLELIRPYKNELSFFQKYGMTQFGCNVLKNIYENETVL